jgi:hypothetical protein
MHLFLRIVVFISVILAPTFAYSQDKPLGKAEDLVKKHIDQVLGELPNFEESYGKEISNKAVQDAVAGNVFGIEGPRKHPWADTGNSMSSMDWFLDSFFNLDARMMNAWNWSQAWSCFEPKLLAKSDGITFVKYPGPDDPTLFAACRAKCPWYDPKMTTPVSIPFSRYDPWPLNMIGAAWYSLVFGCAPPDSDIWGYDQGSPRNPGQGMGNGYEVVEYWFPEYQVEINNYGINRIRPEDLSGTGAQFTRQALLAAKEGIPESKIRSEAEKSYPFDLSQAELVQPRTDPYKGQGVSTSANVTQEDKSYAHIVRTWLSVTMGSKKLNTEAGWEVDPQNSLYDALPKKAEEHDPVNVWTEYGMFDVLTSIPHFSYRVRPDIMNALFGSPAPVTQKVVQDPPFYQNQGAAAYRVARWGDYFGVLQDNFKIQPNANAALKEAVYKGGYELFPLVTRNIGFGAPQISSAAVFARRSLYIAGAKSPKEEGGDESGEIEKFFPQGAEKGRIITYTISRANKAQEIDKMQLISPKRPKAATTYGGIPPIVSECFRSQSIPNMVNPDQDLEKWAEGPVALGGSGGPSTQGNLTRKLNGYFSDTDFLSQQGGSITFTYWNRRIGCFCDRCGLPTGSSSLDIPGSKGDGDQLYDVPRMALCRYPLNPQMTPWSAWAKKDTFQECMKNGQFEPYDGTGLRDTR